MHLRKQYILALLRPYHNEKAIVSYYNVMEKEFSTICSFSARPAMPVIPFKQSYLWNFQSEDSELLVSYQFCFGHALQKVYVYYFYQSLYNLFSVNTRPETNCD